MAYIEKHKLMSRIETEALRWGEEYDLSQIMGDIEDFPESDVVEVKHGYWKDRYGNKYDNHLYECSVCGKKALYEFYYDELQQTKTRQVLSSGCPHCLAKMDGKGDT